MSFYSSCTLVFWKLVENQVQRLCPGLPSQVNLEILAANAKVAEVPRQFSLPLSSGADLRLSSQAVHAISSHSKPGENFSKI